MPHVAHPDKIGRELAGSFLGHFLVSGCASWCTYSTAVCCIHRWNLSRRHTSCLGLGSAYKWYCDRMWSDMGQMWLLVSVFTSRINIFVLFIKLMLLFRYCVVQSALGECHHNSEFFNWWCYLSFIQSLSPSLHLIWMKSISVLLVTELKYNLYYHHDESCHLLFLLLRFWAKVLKSSTHTYSNVERCDHIIHTHLCRYFWKSF